MEKRRLGRVEVLRLILIAELAGTKRNRSADRIEDREDQPVAEEVEIAVAGLARPDQAADLKTLAVPALLADHRHQAVPPVGGVAEAEDLDHLVAHAPPLEIRPGLFPMLRVLQQQLEEIDRLLIGRRRAFPLARALRWLTTTRLRPPRRQFHPAPLGEVFHRLDERHLVIVHHKRKTVAARPARKAFVDLLLRADLHRRAFVVVERAKPREFLALRPKVHLLADQADDVRGGLHLLFVAVVTEAHRTHQPHPWPGGLRRSRWEKRICLESVGLRGLARIGLPCALGRVIRGRHPRRWVAAINPMPPIRRKVTQVHYNFTVRPAHAKA